MHSTSRPTARLVPENNDSGGPEQLRHHRVHRVFVKGFIGKVIYLGENGPVLGHFYATKAERGEYLGPNNLLILLLLLLFII